MTNYIPSKVVVGKLQHAGSRLLNPSFLTCKYKSKWWTNDLKFKQLTGYTRYTTKDCVKNMQRDITGAVFEIDNVPISGVKIIDTHTNLYNDTYYVNMYLLEDPRGFTIATNFTSLLKLLNK